MPEIPIRHEALDLAAEAIDPVFDANQGSASNRDIAAAVIRAFCEAEGLTVETKYYGRVTGSSQRLVGPWRVLR
jgi:hypothetical protein